MKKSSHTKMLEAMSLDGARMPHARQCLMMILSEAECARDSRMPMLEAMAEIRKIAQLGLDYLNRPHDSGEQP